MVSGLNLKPFGFGFFHDMYIVYTIYISRYFTPWVRGTQINYLSERFWRLGVMSLCGGRHPSQLSKCHGLRLDHWPCSWLKVRSLVVAVNDIPWHYDQLCHIVDKDVDYCHYWYASNAARNWNCLDWRILITLNISFALIAKNIFVVAKSVGWPFVIEIASGPPKFSLFPLLLGNCFMKYEK